MDFGSSPKKKNILFFAWRLVFFTWCVCSTAFRRNLSEVNWLKPCQNGCQKRFHSQDPSDTFCNHGWTRVNADKKTNLETTLVVHRPKGLAVFLAQPKDLKVPQDWVDHCQMTPRANGLVVRQIPDLLPVQQDQRHDGNRDSDIGSST